MNGFGMASRDTGQSRVPEPPHKMIACITLSLSAGAARKTAQCRPIQSTSGHFIGLLRVGGWAAGRADDRLVL